LNILQILPSLDVGGVETGTVDLAKYLVLNGHKAVVRDAPHATHLIVSARSGGGQRLREAIADGERAAKAVVTALKTD